MFSRYLVMFLLFLAAVAGPALMRTSDTPAAPSPEPPPVPAEALEALKQGRYWRASQILQGYLATVPEPTPASVLLAAQAQAGWGDWAGVERLLAGKGWLDTLAGGYGWNLLGRSRLELGRWQEGEAALSRYLALAPDQRGARRLSARRGAGAPDRRLDRDPRRRSRRRGGRHGERRTAPRRR